jgi:hypothetical protein
MATGINLKNLQLHSIETTATRCMLYGFFVGPPFANGQLETFFPEGKN